ncbi:hypothetical protein HZS_7748, partial [Henneguya salminicola]
VKMMEREPKKLENASKTPQMCRMNCGFYANPLFDGLCCKCNEKSASDPNFIGICLLNNVASHYSNRSYRSAMNNMSRKMEDDTPLTSDNDDTSVTCTCEQPGCSECYSEYGYYHLPIINDTLINTIKEIPEPPKKIEPIEPVPEDPKDICYD